MKRTAIIIFATICMAGCRHHPSEDHHHSEHEDLPAHEEGYGHHEGANAYMHQSSIEELVARFDSPERDAYQKPEAVLEYLGDLQGKKIMDIGAGSGYFTFRLANAGAHVIAGDVEDGFLEHIEKRMKEEAIGPDAIELRKLPYDAPLLAEKEVDMVLVVNTYHHIEERKQYFAKVHQGIKPGGELVIIDFFMGELPVGPPPEHKISSEQVVKELVAAGFREFDVNDTLLDYQFILRAK